MEAASVSRSEALARAMEPFVGDPAGTAFLCDIDGTIAPIVERAHDARVPEDQRRLLGVIAARYALAACVSGRAAAEARRLVGIGGLTYIGNHGLERLRPGAARAEVDPRVAKQVAQAAAFLRAIPERRLRTAKLRIEDKGPVQALHWRGAPDEKAAEDLARELAAEAEAAGLSAHWGKKVLELRPAIDLDKGVAVTALLEGTGIRRAVFGGDDRTDLDAFRALHEMARREELDTVLCIAVSSSEGPPELTEEADLVVDGTPGFLAVLSALTA